MVPVTLKLSSGELDFAFGLDNWDSFVDQARAAARLVVAPAEHPLVSPRSSAARALAARRPHHNNHPALSPRARSRCC